MPFECQCSNSKEKHNPRWDTPLLKKNTSLPGHATVFDYIIQGDALPQLRIPPHRGTLYPEQDEDRAIASPIAFVGSPPQCELSAAFRAEETLDSDSKHPGKDLLK